MFLDTLFACGLCVIGRRWRAKHTLELLSFTSLWYIYVFVNSYLIWPVFLKQNSFMILIIKYNISLQLYYRYSLTQSVLVLSCLFIPYVFFCSIYCCSLHTAIPSDLECGNRFLSFQIYWNPNFAWNGLFIWTYTITVHDRKEYVEPCSVIWLISLVSMFSISAQIHRMNRWLAWKNGLELSADKSAMCIVQIRSLYTQHRKHTVLHSDLVLRTCRRIVQVSFLPPVIQIVQVGIAILFGLYYCYCRWALCH